MLFTVSFFVVEFVCDCFLPACIVVVGVWLYVACLFEFRVGFCCVAFVCVVSLCVHSTIVFVVAFMF